MDLAKSSGVELTLSTSAGEFVCNELLYKVLWYTKDKKTEVTFIHIPGLDDYENIHLAFESMINGL